MPVTYSRDAQSQSLTAVRGLTRRELTSDEHGASIDSFVTDYLILRTDLALCDTEVIPKQGDQVKEEDGTVFETTSIAGEPCWRWSDPTRQVLRIHVQQVKAKK